MRKPLLALACVCGLSCAPEPSGSIALSWQFADGRRCIDAGVFTVTADSGMHPLGMFACEAGFLPRTVTLDSVPASAELILIAISAQGQELYRGPLHPGALPGTSATAILYATASR